MPARSSTPVAVATEQGASPVTGTRAPDPVFEQRFEAEQLRLVTSQVARLPLVLIAINTFAAWLTWRAGWPALAIVWLVLATAFDVARSVLCSVERNHPSGTPGPRLRLLSMAFVAAALLRIALIPPVFTANAIDLQVTLTMVYVGLAAGGIATVGGVWWAYFWWSAIVGGTLALSWMLRGGADNIGIGFLVALMFTTLAFYARDQGRTLRKLLELVHDNESLASSLRVERDRAEVASHSKTRFFAAASHDLRQPLHALSINATTLELLARRQPASLIQELSRSINRSLKQSNDLLDTLLDISQLDAGVVEVTFERVDARELLLQLRDEFEATAHQRGLTLSVAAQGPPLARMHTDAKQIRRILVNLVSNALKFTREGGVTLELAATKDDRIRLSVVDTGPGIVPEEHDRVFEDFYQLGNPSRDRSRGLGLGLSIVRRTAALVGAEIALFSKPGAGCRFDVLVPSAHDSIGNDSEGASASALMTIGEEPPQLRMRVLVVDDEVEILDSLANLLPLYACEVRCVTDLTAAHDALDSGFRPEILVVDHRLRESSGTEVIAAIRARLDDVPAVIVTGDTSPQDLRNAMGSGTHVVYKPIDGTELARAMAAAAGGV